MVFINKYIYASISTGIHILNLTAMVNNVYVTCIAGSKAEVP